MNEIGVSFTEHVLLRSRDPQRSLDVICSKSYQYGEGPPSEAPADDVVFCLVFDEESYCSAAADKTPVGDVRDCLQCNKKRVSHCQIHFGIAFFAVFQISIVF